MANDQIDSLGNVLKRLYRPQDSPAESPPKSSDDRPKQPTGGDSTPAESWETQSPPQKPNKLKQYWAMTAAQKRAAELAELDERGRGIDPSITVCSMLGWRQASCVDCRDLGWTGSDLPFGDPGSGKLHPCHCQAQAQADRALSVIAGEEAHQVYSFLGFRTNWPWPAHNELAAMAKAAAEAWVSSSGPPWLILEGPPGTGKSHLAMAALREIVAGGGSVAYYQAGEYLDLLRAGIGSEAVKEAAESAKERVLSADGLVLDDYGVQRNTDWAIEQLEGFLGYRYQRCLRTLITTNSLDGASPRLVSRFSDREKCVLVSMAGAMDIRPHLGR